MNAAAERHYWILASDPRQYHWDTLFVKGKEMWRGAGGRPQVTRVVKQMRRGDRVLAYHSAPDRWVYALAEVTRDPYPDPQDPAGKALIIDLRALERLGQPVRLADMKTNSLLRSLKFLKNPRLPISPVSAEEYREILRMGGIVASPGMPVP
ncbi:MAG TPA: EVE domain-containing protein [Candidatus Acidoferrales bacterium]|nr:EVE domain-containing protein [Candidatus Acidoferrales bacterium]